MFSEVSVRALLRDKRLKAPVASIYLNTDRSTPEGEKYLAAFRHLLHQTDQLLGRRADVKTAIARERLTDALAELIAFLDEEIAPQPAIRGVALFLSLAAPSETDVHAPAFTTFTLPRPIRNQTTVDRRPAIRPLLFLLDQYERIGVIVTDQHHARIFTLFLGELEHIVRRTAHRHRGGWTRMLFQRDVDGHVRAHLRATVREATRLFREHPLKRLVLGGTDESVALVRRELPHALQQLVVGTFPADAHMRDGEVVSRALARAQAAERAEEEQRVQELAEELSTSAAPTWDRTSPRAVHGAEHTLRALTERRVRRLLLRRGFRTPGAVCDNCGALTLQTAGPCPSCRTRLRPVTDVLEHAVECAQAENAEVEFVTESPTLEALGSIGAFLRF